MVKVLFVCMGNICRSPTAEGVFSDLIKREKVEHHFVVDSAGTHAYHIGEPPDPRAQATARQRGIDMAGLSGRQVQASDFEEFEYILAMDRENYEHLLALCPAAHEHKIQLFMQYAPHRPEEEVPDPYFGGTGGFDRVLDMIGEAAIGLLAEIRNQRNI